MCLLFTFFHNFHNPLTNNPHINFISFQSPYSLLNFRKHDRFTRGSVSSLPSPHPSLNPLWLLDHFCEQRQLKPEEAITLIDHTRALLAMEPNVIDLEAPIVVVGDIHGQFFDLVKIFDLEGPPSKEKKYLFLGDYVDRGKFSCEVCPLPLPIPPITSFCHCVPEYLIFVFFMVAGDIAVVCVQSSLSITSTPPSLSSFNLPNTDCTTFHTHRLYYYVATTSVEQ